MGFSAVELFGFFRKKRWDSVIKLRMTCDNFLIGTSGYDYPEWKGVFYPDDLPRKQFLSYYASQFNALELNNTFYSMPTAERLQSLYQRTEGKPVDIRKGTSESDPSPRPPVAAGRPLFCPRPMDQTIGI